MALISACCCFTCQKSIHEGRSNLSTPRGYGERGNYPPTYRRPKHEYHRMLITSFPTTLHPSSSLLIDYFPFVFPFVFPPILIDFFPFVIIFVSPLYFSAVLALIFLSSSVGRSAKLLLDLASIVILGFRSRREPGSRFLFSPRYHCVSRV
jgi:hypothetical protein